MTIGQRIRLARSKVGISQKGLAEKLGVSASMIGQYESDVRKPKFETQQRIAEALGVEVYEIFSDEQRKVYTEGEISGLSVLELGFVALSFPERSLIDSFNKLNPEGQQKAVERIEELAEIPKYQK